MASLDCFVKLFGIDEASGVFGEGFSPVGVKVIEQILDLCSFSEDPGGALTDFFQIFVSCLIALDCGSEIALAIGF